MNKNINELREEIDDLDNELINILSRRFEVTRKIGSYKKQSKEKSLDNERLNQIIEKFNNLSISQNIDQDMSREIILIIHNQVIKEHENKIYS